MQDHYHQTVKKNSLEMESWGTHTQARHSVFSLLSIREWVPTCSAARKYCFPLVSDNFGRVARMTFSTGWGMSYSSSSARNPLMFTAIPLFRVPSTVYVTFGLTIVSIYNPPHIPYYHIHDYTGARIFLKLPQICAQLRVQHSVKGRPALVNQPHSCSWLAI